MGVTLPGAKLSGKSVYRTKGGRESGGAGGGTEVGRLQLALRKYLFYDS